MMELEKEQIPAIIRESENFSWSLLGELEKSGKLAAFTESLNKETPVACFSVIKANVLSDLSYQLHTLKKYGDAVSRNQGSEQENFYLKKTWGNLTHYLTHEFPHYSSSTYIHTEKQTAKEDAINSDVAIPYLEYLRDKIENIYKYGTLILLFYTEQDKFMQLDIRHA